MSTYSYFVLYPLEKEEEKYSNLFFLIHSTDNPEILYKGKYITCEEKKGEAEEEKREIKGCYFQHYRNKKYYQVIDVAYLGEQKYVVYKALYNDPIFGNECKWARKYEEFFGQVKETIQEEEEGEEPLQIAVDRFEEVENINGRWIQKISYSQLDPDGFSTYIKQKECALLDHASTCYCFITGNVVLKQQETN